MNILFLTIIRVNDITERGIYNDLMRHFRDNGHKVYIICPTERRFKQSTQINESDGINILQVKTLNIQKTNLIEKGIGTLLLEKQFLAAVKNYFSSVKFDLILYSTPPITFTNVIRYIKAKDQAKSYLLLKDIFPQNAVDLKMIKENGILHQYFKKKERQLYENSDFIGCMSDANKTYLLKNNTYLKSEIVEVNPNTIEPLEILQTDEEKIEVRLKYDLPIDKKIFVYGGNLGKPQGLDFLMTIIQENRFQDIYFLVVGSGTEYNRIKQWFANINPQNAKLLDMLPKEDYDSLLNACDVGMIFLHKDFTIPNFPSRLLSYLEMKMPVIAATDKNSDIGYVIENAKCGFSVLSGDNDAMHIAIKKIIENIENYSAMKDNAWKLLQENYIVDISYNLIIRKMANV